ncbi:tripartite tricarboxylate transporter TctB family protein [Corticibacter populi]|uniref:Tripartite tricarboxylate transporter TctB family protein n=1 Tax=Corticibacter populi TaxID=1550736 RepID=A0A3M6QYK2_9BURK|nr:tripartite tricarboxylate transporter TctB family protein [Corticibacter populi]RMX08001.1 tripartite tricarboxylate transporter TctB family protein [Corticibacter populi]RZS35244.1 putative tricarboxylic transport membrane protein [Corticibacter populi]
MNDRKLGIAALALAVVMFWQGWGLEAPFSYEPLGPRAFPLLIAAVMAVCGIVLVVKGGGQSEPNPPGASLRIGAMFLVIVGYALIYQPAGFIIATALMTMLVGRLFGGGWLKPAVCGVLGSVLFFFLFDRVLDVVLPLGVLEAWL